MQDSWLIPPEIPNTTWKTLASDGQKKTQEPKYNDDITLMIL